MGKQGNTELNSVEMSKKSGASTFLKGTAILGISAIIIKVLGAIFRIPLGNIIGDEGMGYYQTAYPLYNLILVISTAGIPTAIAKIVAGRLAVGDVKGAERVFKVTFRLMAITGAIITGLVLLGAMPLVHYLNNDKAFLSVAAIAPAIFFISMTECYRGFFQGSQHMTAFAASQITEQFVRVVLGLSLAILLLGMGKEYASAGATFGATAGCFGGFVVILYLYNRFRKKHQLESFGTHLIEPAGKIIKTMLMIAIPVTLGASILPVMSIADLGIVFRRLADIGFTPEVANQLYGQLTGFALTIVNLPQVMTAAIQISIVPAVAHFAALKDKKSIDHTIETGLRIGLIIGLPAAVGMSVLSEDIMRLLYPMQLDIAQSTGSLLFIFGFGIIFLAIYQVTTGVLQGINKQAIPAINLLIAAMVKVALTYILVGMPSLNIKGAALATDIALAIAALLNFFALVRVEKLKLNYSHLFTKPIIATLVMGIVVKFTMFLLPHIVSNSLSTAISVLVGGLVYGIMLLITKTVTDEDLELMPGGAKLKKIMNKLGL